MTGDDIFELAERLDRIAAAVERIADATEPATATVVDLPGPPSARKCTVYCMPSCSYPKCLS